ncbi:MAG TPA: hypothetical protein PKI11_12700 [Candidatus Hydrogenedentes bacterium]|nr:hypothetical protein [Candidatus Hydrogenedentota bacterium]HNT87503.1 hypothetical protein [Candidatus Hydrogenedentota bacterium]
MMKQLVFVSLPVMAVLVGAPVVASGQPTFADDLAFLMDHLDVIALVAPGGKAQVAVVPAYQGRVMTSTARGPEGVSFGWVNRELIASGKIQPHINVYGGEDRFWMGPEGGQFAIFFAPDAPFDLEHWQTPAVIDTEPFDVVEQAADRVSFRKTTRVGNRAGASFDVRIDRVVRMLSPEQVGKILGVDLPEGLDVVAYETENTLTNVGDAPWQKETGLLSIWILGMYNASPDTTVVVPFVAGPESELGPKINDAYFGKVPPDRLVVGEDIAFFKGDARHRGKLGVAPRRAKPVIGSYDARNHALTIVHYTKPEGAEDYVNSMWELQDAPYAGDVVNSYNDGPLAPGKPGLGNFYELETSSPAAALPPKGSITHVHRTIHLQGDEAALSAVAGACLGASTDAIQSAFGE